MAIERYSHVIHLVSNVRGRLAPDKTPFDLFASTFPAGTVSGAPKIRARQIISELEPEKRGLYAGAIGYFGYNGNLDTCIVIRTIVMKGKQVFINAGAGIVADSDPGGLTERQTEVLRLVADGLTYREVGEQLSLSERTVRYHMSEIIARLHLYNRSQVLAYVGKHGLT